jgi:hypothetical protein
MALHACRIRDRRLSKRCTPTIDLYMNLCSGSSRANRLAAQPAESNHEVRIRDRDLRYLLELRVDDELSVRSWDNATVSFTERPCCFSQLARLSLPGIERQEVTGKRYRIIESTLAMVQFDGHHVALTIPAGSVIVLTGGPLDGNRLVDVTWNGEAMMMFTQDLRTRGELTADDA